MVEFLGSYGIWMVLGLFLLFMMWGHGRGHGGMGCGMGVHRDNSEPALEEVEEEEQPGSEKRSSDRP